MVLPAVRRAAAGGAARSCCSTAAGTTAPASSTSWGSARRQEYRRFLRQCPIFERLLVEDGIMLIKYWFSVSDEEQERRFAEAHRRPDAPVEALARPTSSRGRSWVDYSRAKDEMFVHTDIPEAPWYVVEADDKRTARLNCIAHLLSQVPYEPRPGRDDRDPAAPARRGIRAAAARAVHVRARPRRRRSSATASVRSSSAAGQTSLRIRDPSDAVTNGISSFVNRRGLRVAQRPDAVDDPVEFARPRRRGSTPSRPARTRSWCSRAPRGTRDPSRPCSRRQPAALLARQQVPLGRAHERVDAERSAPAACPSRTPGWWSGVNSAGFTTPMNVHDRVEQTAGLGAAELHERALHVVGRVGRRARASGRRRRGTRPSSRCRAPRPVPSHDL